MANLPIILLGSGGHAKVVKDTLTELGVKILGITDPDPKSYGKVRIGLQVLGGDDYVTKHSTDTLKLVNGIGTIGRVIARRKVFEEFKRKGYEFLTVVHPSAILANDVILEEGVQVMAGAVIQPGVRIGRNVIINTRATIDHDCVIGDHSHIAPGATLSGNIHVGEAVHIGVGATVIQGINIGMESIVAGGAIVFENVESKKTVSR
jgi:sugar O-acyltransferase (sialic acid O-acetyltransferase NeuD family)